MTSERETDAQGRPVLKAHVIDADPNAAKMLHLVLSSLDLDVSVQNLKHDISATIEKLLPDFVVTEINIPNHDLFQVLENIYRDRRFARTKILLCSSKDDVGIKKRLHRKYNLDRVYTKPLNADKFRRDLTHMIGLKYKQLGWKAD